ncbi:hypothetical protein [Alterisphingorhabdus coralli]|uniref:Uncharacterized protein n=1 Tax=Alterisphingorhabdus coralli TaxID=3071408 RepID=A0AA97F8S5_9SPHN|nr:hypothetical protein [Parasphingorhabdus sp. SCSIO 66989]WOE74575.1 hypothetical protein RB602_12060 [Parasphingorhabdus sp. SCSIO 66989]
MNSDNSRHLIYRIILSILSCLLLSFDCQSPNSSKYDLSEIIDESNNGISTIIVDLRGGNWSDRDSVCGNSHLFEHILGRKIFEELLLSQLDFGFSVNGFTSPDSIIIIVKVGGARAGVISALESIQKALGTTPAREIVSQEIRVVNAEIKRLSKPSHDLGQLTASLKGDNGNYLIGNCLRLPDQLDVNAEDLIIDSISVIYESGDSILYDRLNISNNRESSNLAIKGTDFIEGRNQPSAVYFNAAPQDDLDGTKTIKNLALWHYISGKIDGKSQIHFTPISKLGFIARINEEIDNNILQSYKESFLKLNDEEFTEHIKFAQNLFCANMGRKNEDISLVSHRVSIDYWASMSTFTRVCKNNHYAEFMPGSYEDIYLSYPMHGEDSNFSSNTRHSELDRNDNILNICNHTMYDDGIYYDYYHSLMTVMILQELRFQKGVVLSVKKSYKSDGCFAFMISEMTTSRTVIKDTVRQLFIFEDNVLNSMKINRAHKALCLEFSLLARDQINDRECSLEAKAGTVKFIKEFTNNASYTWNVGSDI